MKFFRYEPDLYLNLELKEKYRFAIVPSLFPKDSKFFIYNKTIYFWITHDFKVKDYTNQAS